MSHSDENVAFTMWHMPCQAKMWKLLKGNYKNFAKFRECRLSPGNTLDYKTTLTISCARWNNSIAALCNIAYKNYLYLTAYS